MFWKHLWTFLLGIIFIYVQVLIMPAFELFGVIPHIHIPLLVYFVWTRERNANLIISFLIGLIYDTTQPASFGLHALLFVLLVVSLEEFRKPFEEDSLVAKILTILLANLVFHLIQLLIFGVSYEFSTKLLVTNLIGFAYNLLVSFVVFWAMQFLSRLRIVVARD